MAWIQLVSLLGPAPPHFPLSFLWNPRGPIRWGAREVSLALSPILLLCFNARKGPPAPVPPALGPFTPPTLARTINRGHCSSVFTPFRLHLPLLPPLISVSLLLCHREERERLSKCRFCPDRMQRLGRTSRSNLDLVGVFRKGSRDTFLLEGLKARCTGEHTGCSE